MNQPGESEIQKIQKQKMKHYVKVRINRLMKRAGRGFDESHDSYEEIKLVRQAGWDYNEFHDLIEGHAEEIQQHLDEYRRNNGSFHVEHTSPDEDATLPHKHVLAIYWDISNDNPFDDLYDEDLGIDTPEDE